ncbi:MAG TPA: hypothetical protein DCM40_43940 [Maribacter sp.]|nr:hypothetical protein [Maribacter sp.]
MNTLKKNSVYKRFKAVMVYMPESMLSDVKKFARKNKTNVSFVVREGLKIKMSQDDNAYEAGKREGFALAQKTVDEYLRSMKKTLDDFRAMIKKW